MSLANLAQRTAGAVALGDAEERWRCGKFWEPIIAEYLLYNLISLALAKLNQVDTELGLIFLV